MSTASNPTGFNLTPGIAANDHVTVQDPAGGTTPQGTVAFFLCGPGQTNAGGCPGGNAEGTVKPLIAGTATSDTTTSTTTLGTYCWRAVYTPAGGSLGIIDTAVHTNATTECFAVGVPGPPNAGRGMDLPMPPPAFVDGTSPAGNAPIRLRIPGFGVDANVEGVDLAGNGVMDVPQSVTDVGWLRSGVAPGLPGNAVITGHLDGNAGQPAAFWLLGDLRMGDPIFVTTADSRAMQFIVTKVGRYDRTSFPLLSVFGPSGQAHLNLITCAGPYLGSDGGYRDRLVVFTTLIGATIS